MAFLKSPVGQMFHQFFGENMLRADVCNSVEELGQLLDHTGPVAESERNAARIFNADHCFFVTNGTSTSNKMVWHHTVAPGDVVVVDRNCHKSILHSIIMTGAVPVFLTPTRNHFGIIGPIPESEFSPEAIRRKIAANPLLAGVDASTVKPRILTVTQSTYDGVLYNTETIKDKLDGWIDTLHFDEAWLPHAAFHKFYAQYHAMGKYGPRPKDAVVYATQSTHKLLAGLSPGVAGAGAGLAAQQARPAPVQRGLPDAHVDLAAVRDHRLVRRGGGDDGAARAAPRWSRRASARRSTSAARCARSTRSSARTGGSRSGARRSWPARASATATTGCSMPTRSGTASATWRRASTCSTRSRARSSRRAWTCSGKFAKSGIPASIVTKFLAEHGVVVEKTGLYSFFIMFTIGITKGRWNTLLTALQQFKDDYDRTQPMWRILPEFCAAHPMYERMGLRDLCQSIHEMYAKGDIARLVTEMYLSDLHPAMKPADAYARIAHRDTERVDIDALEGRITTSLLTPYPPGIPLLIPGERFNRKIVDYLRFTREFNQRFPGFDTDVHGLVEDEVAGPDGRKRYYVDCVRA